MTSSNVQTFPLHLALRSASDLTPAGLDALLELNDPAGLDSHGMTPLMVAVSQDRADRPLPAWCLNRLLEVGHPEAVQASQGNTALLYAARHGLSVTVKALLPYSNVQHRNLLGNDVLYAAALNTHDPLMVPTVLPFSDPLRAYPMASRQTALMLALQNGSPDGVRALMAVSDLNAQDVSGFTPLTLALRYSPPSLLNVLLERDALQETVPENGWSALMLALLNRHLKDDPPLRLAVVERLLDLGARTDPINEDGQNVLDLALAEADPDQPLLERLGKALPVPVALNALVSCAQIAPQLADALRSGWVHHEQERLRAAMGPAPVEPPLSRRDRL